MEVAVAALLCWVGSVILVTLPVLSLGPSIVDFVRRPGELVAFVVFLPLFILGTAYGYAGYQLWSLRRAGGWVAVATAAIVVLVQVVRWPPNAWIWANLAVLLLVVRNWDHLAPSRRSPGA